jgi:hypothetical protein
MMGSGISGHSGPRFDPMGLVWVFSPCGCDPESRVNQERAEGKEGDGDNPEAKHTPEASAWGF